MQTATSSAGDRQARVAGLLREIAAIGPVFDPGVLARTRALYQSAFDPPPAGAAVDVQLDLAYGPHERDRLDLYRPRGKASPPVVVFIHGGGFVAGDKRGDDQFYRNVGEFFARNGFAAALCNYRLAPAFPWPAGMLDVGSAIDWIALNARSLDVDARQLFAIGQSAGACHLAGYLFDKASAAAANVRLRAAMLLSGTYRLIEPLGPGPAAYFGTATELYEHRSPIVHLRNSEVPLFIGVAEFDPPGMARHSFDLAMAVTMRDRKSPVFAWMAGHNHVSTVHSLGSVQTDMGEQLLGFLARHAA